MRARSSGLLLLALASLLALQGCYLLKQGAAILSCNCQARDIERMLQEPGLAPELRQTLLLVLEIKRYAVETLGLKENRNYTRYVALERKYLVDVVSACAKDRFQPYLWRYCFFGSFPYKGFFARKDALREAEALKRRDLDVLVRPVDAFSTLGFFNDPVYSFMDRYSVFELASLILHEQTHATLFLKNEVQFNEELASFMGQEGALGFIRKRYGPDSAAYRQAMESLQDQDAFHGLILGLYGELEALYRGPASREEKLTRRREIFAAFNRELGAAAPQRFKSEEFRGLHDLPLNNAYVMAFVQYTEHLGLFTRLYQALGGDLRETFARIRGVKNRRGKAKAYLEELIAAAESGR